MNGSPGDRRGWWSAALVTSTAAVLLIGCGDTQAKRIAPTTGRAGSQAGAAVVSNCEPDAQGRHMHKGTSGDEISSWEATVEATETQKSSARAFASSTIQAIGRYSDVAAARRDGYSIDESELLIASVSETDADAFRQSLAQGYVNHLFNPDLANDGIAADPSKPDGLMYATDGEQNVLVGAVFLAPVCTHGPQIGGPMTVWHVHPANTCYDGTAPVGIPEGFQPGVDLGTVGDCSSGQLLEHSPEMLHVWTDAPDLPATFSTAMSATWALDQLK